ncbi:Rv2231c family pyridoxal phosphate-dependent protein CobC [Nocardiopsis mangrovi]|uniref:Aminotransferase n=1 Tax=Nocardiopsis mangrovi TaxID=1179818 RepID=A0ABV9DTH8_9ACTN
MTRREAAAPGAPRIGHAGGADPGQAHEVDLHHHGDAETGPGLLDFAVNVRTGTPPAWLAERIAASLSGLAAYPDPRPARAAVAARHGRDPAGVLLTAGAAEAFVLLARVLAPRRAVVVHPQFTEPEAALRAAGHAVDRVLLTAPGFLLDPARIPDDADLVMVGNPTNPTSVLHPSDALARLARPGRTLVVDEAFADCVPGEPESLAGRAGIPGLVVLRSLTKTWGLAGLRAGYLLAEPGLVARLAAAQPLWSVSTPALAATEACCAPEAVAEADAWAREMAGDRAALAGALGAAGLHVTPGAAASFLLVKAVDGAGLRVRLRAAGIAVRRGDTFPGLGPDWLRIAVRDRWTSLRMARTLAELL